MICASFYTRGYLCASAHICVAMARPPERWVQPAGTWMYRTGVYAPLIAAFQCTVRSRQLAWTLLFFLTASTASSASFDSVAASRCCLLFAMTIFERPDRTSSSFRSTSKNTSSARCTTREQARRVTAAVLTAALSPALGRSAVCCERPDYPRSCIPPRAKNEPFGSPFSSSSRAARARRQHQESSRHLARHPALWLAS